MALVPSGGKFVPEHGPPALRRLSRRLVLDDVPMLGEQAVFDTQDVNHDPVHWLPDPSKPAGEHDIVAGGGDQRVLVMQLLRRGLDKVEEPFAPRRDMSTVLAIGGGPATIGRRRPAC